MSSWMRDLTLLALLVECRCLGRGSTGIVRGLRVIVRVTVGEGVHESHGDPCKKIVFPEEEVSWKSLVTLDCQFGDVWAGS